MKFMTIASKLLFAKLAAGEDLATALPEITGALSDFSVANLLTIVTAVIAVCVGLVLVWFAIKWAIRKVSGAFRKGRL